MSPPVIILSDSDDVVPASSTHPTIDLSDYDTHDTRDTHDSDHDTQPVSPAIPSPVPSGDPSADTEPFEEGEVASTPIDSFAIQPLFRPVCGPMTQGQYLYDQYLTSQQFLAADDRPTPPASHHTGSDADDESSDSDTSDTAASIPPPSPPAPIRRRKRVRILEPYEPEPFGELFRYHEGDFTRKCTARKRVCILPASTVTPPVSTPVPTPVSSPISVLPPVSMPDLTPVASPAPPPSPVSPPPEPHPYMLPTYTAPHTSEVLPPMPPPTVFYSQTTTVPIPSPATSPVPSPAPTETPTSPGIHRLVDARRWSFLLDYIRRWRLAEGSPRAAELGDGSSAVLPVTGEPIHHTIPLLAARLVRHEDRLDELLSVIEDISLERIECMQEEVTNLVVHRTALEMVFEMMGTEIEEAQATITEFGHRLDVQRHEIDDLRAIAAITQEMMEHQAQELAASSSTIHTLSATIEEIQARERSRDMEMLGMIRIIRELERRSGGAPGPS